MNLHLLLSFNRISKSILGRKVGKWSNLYKICPISEIKALFSRFSKMFRPFSTRNKLIALSNFSIKAFF